MALELRCPKHPGYTGEVKPGEGNGLSIEGGGSTCPDCWEIFRMQHETPRARTF